MAITNSLRLLQLPDSVQFYIEEGEMTAGHARAILFLEDEKKQLKLADKIAQEKISVRKAENIARLWNIKDQKKKSKIEITPDRQEKVDLLSKGLNSPVKIKDVKQGGKIEIRFLSEEDLERLIKVICRL